MENGRQLRGIDNGRRIQAGKKMKLAEGVWARVRIAGGQNGAGDEFGDGDGGEF